MTDQTFPTGRSGDRSYIGAGSRITGDLYFPGTVDLPGTVNGRIEASAIVIEEAGEVEGELHAASILIRGRFKGQIVGGKVHLHASARVTADISYDTLSIDSGAEIEGRCSRRSTNKDSIPDEQLGGSSAQPG